MFEISKFRIDTDSNRNREVYSKIPKYEAVAVDDKYFLDWLIQNPNNQMKKQLNILGIDALKPDEFYSMNYFDEDIKTIQFYCIYNCFGNLLNESGRIKTSDNKYLVNFVDYDEFTKVSIYEKSSRPVSNGWQNYKNDIIEIEVLWMVTNKFKVVDGNGNSSDV